MFLGEDWPPPPHWPEAACRGWDDIDFFPTQGQPSGPALGLCAGCPVRAECLDYAVPIVWLTGIWGGASENQRRQLRRGLDRSTPPSYTGVVPRLPLEVESTRRPLTATKKSQGSPRRPPSCPLVLRWPCVRSVAVRDDEPARRSAPSPGRPDGAESGRSPGDHGVDENGYRPSRSPRDPESSTWSPSSSAPASRSRSASRTSSSPLRRRDHGPSVDPAMAAPAHRVRRHVARPRAGCAACSSGRARVSTCPTGSPDATAVATIPQISWFATRTATSGRGRGCRPKPTGVDASELLPSRPARNAGTRPESWPVSANRRRSRASGESRPARVHAWQPTRRMGAVLTDDSPARLGHPSGAYAIEPSLR